MNEQFRGKTSSWKNGYVEGKRDVFEVLRALRLSGVIPLITKELDKKRIRWKR